MTDSRRRETLVLAGALAQKPRHGGHTWVLLQYLLGFRRLGWDVLFLDRLDSSQCVDEAGRPCAPEDSLHVAYLRRVLARFGFEGAYALVCQPEGVFIGLSRAQVLARVRRSACFINVMGFFNDADVLAQARQRVFLDIDPGFGQMWRALGLADVFTGHDAFVTIAERIGEPDCAIPTCGLPWLTTRPPVVLDCWPPAPEGERGVFTSIASWRGAYGPVDYQGQTYGLRAHEFRRFAALPTAVPHCFRLALDIHPADAKDIDLLAANGWALVDPRAAARDPWAYQRFIQASWAEFQVAKNMYVRSRSGWFSDRSVCYLASGRPVLAQDTGLRGLYPVGEGLLVFGALDEARDGVAALARDYGRHARAARRLAQDAFDSDRVLGGLLARLGVG